MSDAICRLFPYVSRNDTKAAHPGDGCVSYLKLCSSDRYRSFDMVVAGQRAKENPRRDGTRLELGDVKYNRRTRGHNGNADLRHLGMESPEC
ncbi:hypothetical protein I5693_35095 [Burkholderia cenocepacia]|uniref:hypothetical protein n=1 Tax=Burkholderia cepacia complex TaxID=87882 RepID=UPI0012EDF0B6|nr:MULTISPECIES: hypothetical protein [Burkholderia cepacia complex]MBJ9672787.1 hypothetical protein [Burkholderia cenocepacia]MBJ9734144.1 hypothetical protein [Burkholderia cenocepacia]MCA8089118.1 hypothetical protein [Burkholderia cenocepacia]HEM7885292.1 hypothetical protein [Burkholderia cenocepacia]HEM7902893.1 hypothetical protein [Burkholderia cenocepacia]